MKNKSKKPKNPNQLLGRIFLLTLMIALVVFLFIVNENMSGTSANKILNSVSNFLNGNKSASITFPEGADNSFYYNSSGLAIAQNTGVSIFNMSNGKETFLKFPARQPAIDGTSNALAAFDRGGKNYLAITGKKAVFSGTTENPIINFRINRSLYKTLATTSKDAKSEITVFGANNKELYNWLSAENYIIDANVLPNNKTLVSIGFSTIKARFQGVVLFSDIKEQEDPKIFSVNDVSPISMNILSNGNVAVLFEDRIVILSSKCEVIRSLSLSERKIESFAKTSPRFLSVILEKYSSAGLYELINIGVSKELPTAEIPSVIHDVSSAGSFTAVLLDDYVICYNEKLAEYARYENPNSAQKVLCREDGSVILIGADWAKLLM